MSSEFLWENLSYVICVAALIGILRFKKIVPTYRPFFYFVWWAAANEFISTLASHAWHNNAVNSNIYVLVEFILVLWLFKKWNRGTYSKWFFPGMVAFGVTLWIVDNVILHSIQSFNSLFRVFYSFVIVYLSIEEVNTILFHRAKRVIQNAKFIICATFITYYTYKATFEVFFLIDFGMTKTFYINLYDVLVIVNLFSNLLYGVAALCIPTKQKFTLPY